jgi:hypothetical protein
MVSWVHRGTPLYITISLKETAMKKRLHHILPIALSPFAMLASSTENAKNRFLRKFVGGGGGPFPHVKNGPFNDTATTHTSED